MHYALLLYLVFLDHDMAVESDKGGIREEMRIPQVVLTDQEQFEGMRI
jgi:hypothetical protein